MFAQVPRPLTYAEALLTRFVNLSHLADASALLGELVRGVADLCSCELAQVYLLDAAHTSLEMRAECLEGVVQPRAVAALLADYSGEQLLQYALCQNRMVFLEELSSGLYETAFLPALDRPWHSLLCVPLLNQHRAVKGVLVCASRRRINLQGFASSLSQLGTFGLNQLQLLQRLCPGTVIPPQSSNKAPNTSAYGLVGKSEAMRRAYSLIGKVLQSPYTVLLHGETGTGKEVVARAIHEWGSRRSKAFIVQNCAAIPEELLESELFGYHKGAFTGADRNRLGLLDAADGGTLLLDEIGDMPLSLQAKLLRVLQEGEVRPLGSNVSRKIDVRIIVATHRDLSLLTSQGRFREDLYYRLNQFPIELPPLRYREDDVRDLARHFADNACAFLQRESIGWADGVLDGLCNYSFPGNVRELKGMVERAVLLCEGGQLQIEHFPSRLSTALESLGMSLRERLEQTERTLLHECLRKHRGNKTLAARELRLPRRTLLYRLSRLNIGSDATNE